MQLALLRTDLWPCMRQHVLHLSLQKELVL